MKIDIDVLGPVQRKIRVEIPADAVDKEFVRAYDGIGRRARIKGFRPGKAPRSVLHGLYGDEIRTQVLSRLVEDSLRQIFHERGLQVVSRPQVETQNLEEGKEFKFSAFVEVKPEIALKKYRGLEARKVRHSVTDDQVEDALRRLQESHAHLEPVEERDIVQRGDFVQLDFVGSIDGKPFPGGEAENYLLEVGGGKTLAQFEDGMVGLKKDGEHTISVAYPEDYFNRELAGKRVLFSVTIREIKKKILPPLDDEFAKDYGECVSLKELREQVRSRLGIELANAQERDLKEQLLDRLIEENPFDVPPALVEAQINDLIQRSRSRGDPNPATTGSPPEEIREKLKPQARREVQAMLLIERVAALEGIEVSEEEVRQRIEDLARRTRNKAAEVRELYRRGDAREVLQSQMVFEKALGFLLTEAKIEEVEATVDAREKKS